jgi:peptide chain release factor
MRKLPIRKKVSHKCQYGCGCEMRGSKLILHEHHEIVRRFCLENRCRRLLLFIPFRFFPFSNLTTHLTGFFAAKRVFRTLKKARLLRIGSQHISPCINLHDRIGSTHQLEAYQQRKEYMEWLLQMTRSVPKRKDGANLQMTSQLARRFRSESFLCHLIVSPTHPFHSPKSPNRFIIPLVENPMSSEKQASLILRMQKLGITEDTLLEKFVRGSGAGGQKINKTSNCVFLKHLPTGVAIKCQMERSREMNRFLARRELCDQLEAIRDGLKAAKTQAIEKMRRQKRPRSRRSKQRSVADKRILSSKKSLRRPPSGD